MFPRLVKYWVCSDGMQFESEDDARTHENFLEKDRDNNAYSFSITDPDYKPLDIRYASVESKILHS